MTDSKKVDNFLSLLEQEGLLFSKVKNFKFSLEKLFEGVVFEGKRMIEIGGGTGILSCYAAYRGAKKVVCLEPEADGSTEGIHESFKKIQSTIGCDNVTLENKTFQSFDPGNEKFDIILLHNSINHLDEDACINLKKDEKSREIYEEIFSKISSISNIGAFLIICDCSRYNFFPLLKLKNPLWPAIEWHKHQSPETWAELLSKVGFTNPKINWTTFSRLRGFGAITLGNRFASYFLTSHFRLEMRKSV